VKRTVTAAVYPPPEEGLPYLTVIFGLTEDVIGVKSFSSADEEADFVTGFLNGLSDKLAEFLVTKATKPGHA
jgi:hypothetical protein